AIKKVPMKEVDNPSAINIIENPHKKRIVCKNAFFLNIPRSSFSSLTVIPVIYERKAGYNGSAQGEINDKKPAPNATNKLICSIKSSRPLYQIKDSYHQDSI